MAGAEEVELVVAVLAVGELLREAPSYASGEEGGETKDVPGDENESASFFA